MCCRECWQELKNERGLERCRHCFRYVEPIPRLRLTMTVTDGTGSATFVAMGIVAVALLGHTAASLTRMRE
ncbi:hypothetical protein MKX01_030637, partial [Papaver californicum]